MTSVFAEFGIDPRPDAELSREAIIERNLRVVDLHFHNENPDSVEKAVALYADDVTWEAPGRGIVMKDPAEVLAAYRNIFRVIEYQKAISLRRFATENFVFDDQVVYARVAGDPALMPNIPYPQGTEMCVRLVHCFELKDGRITREIAYEVWRKAGDLNAHDDIPEGSAVEVFASMPN